MRLRGEASDYNRMSKTLPSIHRFPLSYPILEVAFRREMETANALAQARAASARRSGANS